MTTWQANYKDGQGWQDIDEEAIRIEMADLSNDATAEFEIGRDKDGEIKSIDTGHIKYRRIDRATAPLATRKLNIEPDGNVLWA